MNSTSRLIAIAPMTAGLFLSMCIFGASVASMVRTERRWVRETEQNMQENNRRIQQIFLLQMALNHEVQNVLLCLSSSTVYAKPEVSKEMAQIEILARRQKDILCRMTKLPSSPKPLEHWISSRLRREFLRDEISVCVLQQELTGLRASAEDVVRMLERRKS